MGATKDASRTSATQFLAQFDGHNNGALQEIQHFASTDYCKARLVAEALEAIVW